MDDLEGMAQRGFNDIAGRMAVQEEVDKRFNEVTTRMNLQFGEVNERLDRIEKLILADHKRRIERLEVEMRELRDLFSIK